MTNKLFIGVEIGGTKQQIAVGDEQGSIFETKQVKLKYTRGAPDILEWLSESIHSIIDGKASLFKAIGVGFGGPLENATGRVLSSLQVPGWKDFNLKEWFENEFEIPSVVINDTVAGGYAELILGDGHQSDNFFYTNIGTGIGGALFIDGKEYDGIGYGASYLGNTYVPDWTSNKPGAAIKLEQLCSGRSIEQRIRKKGYIQKSSLLELDISNITCIDLAKAAIAGDSFCMQELDRISNTFSIGLCNVLALLAPDTIVIGGGVANMGELLFSRIRKRTAELAFVINKNNFQILQSKLMDKAVIAGALLIAVERFKDK